MSRSEQRREAKEAELNISSMYGRKGGLSEAYRVHHVRLLSAAIGGGYIPARAHAKPAERVDVESATSNWLGC